MIQAEKETIYTKAFQKVLEQTSNERLKEIRQKAFDNFTENGFPTVKKRRMEIHECCTVFKFGIPVCRRGRMEI